MLQRNPNLYPDPEAPKNVYVLVSYDSKKCFSAIYPENSEGTYSAIKPEAKIIDILK